MKLFKVTMVIALSLFLLILIGCAQRQVVQKGPQQEPAAEVAEVPTEEPTPVPEVSKGFKYVVKKGDTLWDISAKDDIYGDPFQWPLLFKANRDQIEDPDIIEVDQELDVRQDFSREEVEDAIQKAKDTPPYVPHTKPRKVLPLKY